MEIPVLRTSPAKSRVTSPRRAPAPVVTYIFGKSTLSNHMDYAI